MINTIELNNKCPKCGHLIEAMTTKQLEYNYSNPRIDIYNIGDKLDLVWDMYIEKGFLVDETFCPKCNVESEWQLNIENNTYVGNELFKRK